VTKKDKEAKTADPKIQPVRVSQEPQVKVVGFSGIVDGRLIHTGLPDSAYQSVPPNFRSQGIRKW